MAKEKKGLLRGHDWQTIVSALAIVIGGFASVRGEMAVDEAGSAKGKANQAKVEANLVKEKTGVETDAVFQVLGPRIEELEKFHHDTEIYIALAKDRMDYLEKILWELMRRDRGATAVREAMAKAPPEPKPPTMTKKRPKPLPRTAEGAVMQLKEGL